MHEAIAEKIGVPVDWQTLVQDTVKLAWKATIGELAPDLETLQLSLLVQEAPAPSPNALRGAIRRQNEGAALRLLQRPEVPGLNENDGVRCWDTYGRETLLHLAIRCNLPAVANAIVARPDFTGINVKDTCGRTALHAAAARGQEPRAILGRADFTELLAVDIGGRTAADWAEQHGHRELSEVLRAAQARLQGEASGPSR